MLESGDPPSLVDIERLVRLKRQLETLKTVERLNAILLGKNRPATAEYVAAAPADGWVGRSEVVPRSVPITERR